MHVYGDCDRLVVGERDVTGDRGAASEFNVSPLNPVRGGTLFFINIGFSLSFSFSSFIVGCTDVDDESDEREKLLCRI